MHLLKSNRKILAGLLLALFFSAFAFLWCLFGCEKVPPSTTLEDVLKTGELAVITRNNAHCYYIYRDQAMGFEYDLAKAFADYLGVRLKVVIGEKWEGMIPDLNNGTGAFIAASMTITPKRQKQAVFSNGYNEIQQHIIIHRSNLSVKGVEDLAGKTVHVRRGTSYQERLEALRKQGFDIKVKLHVDIPTQELIRQVAEKEIEITIADRNIALLNRRYYPQIEIGDPINEKEYLGWVVKRNSLDLRDRINTFFEEIKKSGEFTRIYNKYYKDVEAFDYVDIRAYHRRLETRLPRYKQIIIQAANRHDFDWRLVAAQIYQESHFDPKARSHAGAFGLMQLTLSTARSLGVKNILDPTQNISAGVEHLSNLYDLFDEAEGSNRLFLALAAYNIGQGHIRDAQNLARKMNLDPNKEASLLKTLPLLEYGKYYKKTNFGYARGTEAIQYIKRIMIYYDILKQQGIEYTSIPSRQYTL
ncbi:membrane-bound lytic murein transglycosylase MltF [Thermodesulfobacteriota bacterium]